MWDEMKRRVWQVAAGTGCPCGEVSFLTTQKGSLAGTRTSSIGTAMALLNEQGPQRMPTPSYFLIPRTPGRLNFAHSTVHVPCGWSPSAPWGQDSEDKKGGEKGPRAFSERMGLGDTHLPKTTAPIWFMFVQVRSERRSNARTSVFLLKCVCVSGNKKCPPSSFKYIYTSVT